MKVPAGPRAGYGRGMEVLTFNRSAAAARATSSSVAVGWP